MRAWPSTFVPRLTPTDDSAAPLRLFDTSSGAVQATVPVDDEARMYVCGITPYDATHLGHAATYLTFDLVQRVYLEGVGLSAVWLDLLPLLFIAAITLPLAAWLFRHRLV